MRVRVCHGEGSTGVFVVGRIHPSREVKTWVLVFQRGHFQALELCGARRHRAPVASLRACLVYCVACVCSICTFGVRSSWHVRVPAQSSVHVNAAPLAPFANPLPRMAVTGQKMESNGLLMHLCGRFTDFQKCRFCGRHSAAKEALSFF